MRFLWTNNGKIVNNGEASCNADGASFINNKDIEANSESITLVSKNNAGAEILVADNTALVTIPSAALSEGRVTFVVDAQEDLANIPVCANSLRVTATSINFTDADAGTNGKQDIVMTAKKHLEFRSKANMTITCYVGEKDEKAVYTEFENVYFNADDATSEVRFNVNGTLVAEKTLNVTKNAMVIVNNNLNYASYAYNLKNAGKLYVIGMLNFENIVRPSTEGLAFMGNVFCTGGEEANISWADSSDEAVVATVSDLRNALKGSAKVVTFASDVTINEGLTISSEKTIDLNGFTLYNEATENGWIANTGELTVKNGKINFDGTAIWARGGKLVLIDCGITERGTTGGDAVYVSNSAKVEIRGGWIEATGVNEDDDDVWYGVGIAGGDVTLDTEVRGTFHGGVSVSEKSTVCFEGGKYEGKYWHGLNIGDSEVEITLDNEPEFVGKDNRDIQFYQVSGRINNVEFKEGIYTSEQMYAAIKKAE